MFNFVASMLMRIIILFFIASSYLSCKRDDSFLVGQGVDLEISDDTIFFDTVFTKMSGFPYPRSVNKQIIVRNPEKENIKTQITLGGGNASLYRLNVDGKPGKIFNNIEIPARDSIFIFVEVTLLSASPNPLVVDSILFETNGNLQKTMLTAYGWDAHYFRDSVIDYDADWGSLNDKPIVIVNSVLVAKDKTLTIGPKNHIYNAPGSTLFVAGTLNAQGSTTSPIVFEGDRLDPSFSDVAGQWDGIHILRGSINNIIKHAVIKNSYIGVRVDSLPENGNPNLTIENTIIKNTASYGILGLTASIFAVNVCILNSGNYSFAGGFGGIYQLYHCTFAAESSFGRREPHFIITNVQRQGSAQTIIRNYPLSFDIRNCIIWGPLDSEIGFDTPASNPPAVAILRHSLLKTTDNSLNADNNVLNTNPAFEDLKKGNVALKANSTAINIGESLPFPSTFNDIIGNARDGQPDAGAYEYQ